MTGDNKNIKRKFGRDLKAGDVLLWLGELHAIARIDAHPDLPNAKLAVCAALKVTVYDDDDHYSVVTQGVSDTIGKFGRDLKAGDRLEYAGQFFLIDDIRPAGDGARLLVCKQPQGETKKEQLKNFSGQLKITVNNDQYYFIAPTSKSELHDARLHAAQQSLASYHQPDNQDDPWVTDNDVWTKSFLDHQRNETTITVRFAKDSSEVLEANVTCEP